MNSNFELDAQQWSTLRRLLDTALEMPATEREPWLARLSGDEAVLKDRIRALLQHADGDTRSPLDAMPRVETMQLLERKAGPAWPQAGERIGPYRLVRHLGEGGMGSVWLGERADGLLRRPVALKFPRLNADRHGLAERLARERDFLAALDHPNIARLVDAGVGDDGRPFLALEYVEGEPIDTWCAARALDVRARVRLVAQVADAVAHAHGKLILHRDLKPANILVTADGQARLLDFGIAKLMEDGRAGATELTRIGGRALTPAYAPPEQIAGHPLSVAADVYALGVVLYELLAGRRPYQPKRDTPAALEEEILRADVPPPSTVVKDAAARKVLRGDLDTIVLKALKKAPGERYATVNALADDLRRFLDQRAVLAQPDSAWYRTRKFVARNRVAVGVGAGVVVAIGAVALVALMQAQRALREQQRADRVKSFIASVIADADPFAADTSPSTTVTALLDRATARVDRELADQPEERAEMLRLLGKSYGGQFSLEPAEKVLTEALRQTKALAPSRDNVLAAAETAMELGEVKKQLGKLDEARALAAEALAAAGPDPQDARAGDLYADAKTLAGGLALATGDWAGVLEAAEDAIRIGTRTRGEASARVAFAYGLIAQVAATGSAEQQRSLDAARKSYELFKQVYPAGDKPHPQVFQAEQNYGVALLGNGRLREAAVHVAHALADARALYGDNNVMVGHYAARLGQIHLLQGELERGLREVREANAMLVKLDPAVTVASAGRLRSEALGALWLQRPQEAVAPLEQAVGILEKSRSARPLAMMRAELAIALVELGRDAEAAALLDRIEPAGTTLPPPERPLRARARLALARGDAAAAVPLLQQALEQAQAEPRKPFVVDILLDLARASFLLRDVDGADARAREAFMELDRTTVTVTPQHAAAWAVLGRVDLEQGRGESAIRSLERAVRIGLDLAPASRATREHTVALGRAYRAAGRTADAERLERQAVSRR
jgi:serine/threonine-protein kinase